MLTVIVSVKLLPVKGKDSRFFEETIFQEKKGEKIREREKKQRKRREKKEGNW